MFCMFKLLEKVRKAAIRKAKLLADRALDWLRRAWRRRAQRVTTDPAYAAAAAVVLGACLGFSPVRDAGLDTQRCLISAQHRRVEQVHVADGDRPRAALRRRLTYPVTAPYFISAR